MTTLIETLKQHLQSHTAAPGWCVALSGGLDSSVLLHALDAVRQQQACPPLRAVHIHHGLQAVADSWPQHCQALCAQLEVPLQVIHVQVDAQASTEQAARQARYTALAGQLQAGERLLVAQHADDQSETLLLRLLRGSGVLGLQAMPASRPLGQGLLLRPLLTVARRDLEHYARQAGLDWIDDPSNDSDDFDRNFVRNRVLPLLRQRWPGLDAVWQRTTGHMREAQGLLDELAVIDLQQTRIEPQPDWLRLECLDFNEIRPLSAARQHNLLRYWLRDKTLLPDSAHWAGWQTLLQAGAGAQPLWQLQGGALVRDGPRLYWLPPHWLQSPPEPELTQVANGDYRLPDNGLLRIAGLAAAPLRVGYRQGGEQLNLHGRGRRDLKRLLQEQGVPVFVRNRLPLLFAGTQLIAVAGLPALRAAGASGLQADWLPPA
ncbi:MAG: tRNA lysidine(34) synthetase TilS [Gammaproteobacteria bacterium]|nr:tRNA lysidine(34) synthetase TilS [Gammaproteobacteria bacterium]